MEETFDFGMALELLKAGHKVARKGWNGKGMFIYEVEASDPTYEQLRGHCKDAVDFVHSKDGQVHHVQEAIHINAHIDMKAADGSIVVGWLASQTDMLADDWVKVD